MPSTIKRQWRGWTTPDNADEYQTLLLGTIFPGIRQRGIDGLLHLEAWRRDGDGGEVEFVTS